MKVPTEWETPHRRWWVGYVVAVLGTALGALLKWLLIREVAYEGLFLTFYPAVFAAAVFGGTGPGIFATFLSVLAATVLFIEPVWTFQLGTPGQTSASALFILFNIGLSVLGGRFRNQADALRQSEARLRLAHQVTKVGSFELNLQTGVNTWSAELETMYGLKPGQFPGTHAAWQALVHPDDLPAGEASVERALRTFAPEEGEWRVAWPDGSVHWVFGRYQAFPDAAGKPLRLVGVNVDITHRKRVEEALQKSEERFRALVTAGSYAVYRMAPDWSELRELRGSDFIASTERPTSSWLEKYIPAKDQPHVLDVINKAIRTKSIFELEHHVNRADGSIGWTFSRAIPLLDGQGNITEWFGAAHDVTRRKQAEQAVRESEAWFRTMADAIPQLAWIARADGHSIWFNRRWYEYTGVTPGQLDGWAWDKVVDPKALPRVLEQWRHSIATGEPYDDLEFSLRGRDGHFCPFLTRVMPLKGKDDKVALWFGTATDISELRERERALIRQARLIDLAPAATLVKRRDDVITFWSHGAERLYGWTRAEALGERSSRLLRTVFPESLDHIEAKLKEGKTWSGELRQRTRDDRQVIVQSYWLADRDTHGDIQEILESNTDVTERKRLQEHLEEEVEKRTEEVRETLTELEHMSYSMIHDMRAPLRTMQGFASIMAEECAECRTSTRAEYLQRIRDASVRLDQLLTDALNYNRVLRQDASMTRLDMGNLLRGMIHTYPTLQAHVAEIHLEFEELYVLGNESLLTQCMGNLLNNAVKFVAPGVHPSIRVWAEEHYNGAGTVRIWIEDNGIGIPAEAQDKIFRMFERMHHESEYPGTGVGLAIVKKCVERMNGHVGFESEVGKGSKFWIELSKAVEIREPAGRQRESLANSITYRPGHRAPV